jgi:hypothetical protein
MVRVSDFIWENPWKNYRRAVVTLSYLDPQKRTTSGQLLGAPQRTTQLQQGTLSAGRNTVTTGDISHEALPASNSIAQQSRRDVHL